MSRGFQETSSVYAGSPCSAVRYREPKPPKCHPEREGGGCGGSEGSPHNSWCRSKGRAEILRSFGPTHPSLRSCKEIARRKVGVTLSEKGPNCRGARLCARNSRVRWNPDQGCGRTAVRPTVFRSRLAHPPRDRDTGRLLREYWQVPRRANYLR